MNGSSARVEQECPSSSPQTNAEVDIFEVQEEALIKAANFGKRVAPNNHESAGQRFDRFWSSRKWKICLIEIQRAPDSWQAMETKTSGNRLNMRRYLASTALLL